MEQKINVRPVVKMLRLKDIKPWPDNPREITEDARAGLKISFERYGYIDLMVINKRTGNIIAGHQRYDVLITDGVKRAPMIVVDVPRSRERQISITLNNPAIMGTWTVAIVPMLEKLQKEMGQDFIDLRLRELQKEVADLGYEETGTGRTLPDDIPELPKKAKTRRGDLWILGKHRLLCGDSTDEKDIKRLMGKAKARLFATDPPYFVNYNQIKRPKTKSKNWENIYHEVQEKDAEDFLHGFLSCGLRVSENNVPIYLWHAYSRRALIDNVLERLSIHVHQQIIWHKPCGVISYSVYILKHEPCLLGWMKGKKPYFKPAQSNKYGTVWLVNLMRTGDPATPEYYTDIWHLDWQGKKRPSKQFHPTIKPTEIFAIPMRVHTDPGDICFEPFSGSGSQIIAAERVRRRCFAIEIEPVFCDVAVKRWEDFTGKKARLIKAKNKKGGRAR